MKSAFRWIYKFRLTLAAGALVTLGVGCAWFGLSAPAKAEAPAAEDSPASTSQLDPLYLEARLAMAEGSTDQAIARLESCGETEGCPDYVFATLAQLYLDRTEIDKAQKILQKGLERHPQSVRLRLLLSRLYRYTGRVDDAIAVLHDALKEAPHVQAVLEDLSDLYLQRLPQVKTQDELTQEIKSLVEIYELMLETRQGAERIPALLVLSSLHLRLNDAQKALDAAKEAKDLDGHEARVYQALAAAYEKLGQPDSAIDAYRELLLAKSANDEIVQKLNQLLERKGGAAARTEFYTDLATKHPDVRDVQMLAARMLMRGESWTEAETILKKTMQTWPDQDDGWMALATAEAKLNKPEETIKAVGQALQHDATSNEALDQVQTLLTQIGDQAAKDKLLDSLIADHPEDKDIQLLAAKLLIQAQKWDRAEAVLKNILAKWPGDIPTRLALVRTWLALGRLEEAIAEARALGRESGPFAPMVSLAVAQSLNEAGRRADAIGLLREAAGVNPGQEALATGLASMLLEDRQYGEAATLLEAFMKNHPGSYLATVMLTEAYAQTKRFDDAQALIEALPEDVEKQYDQELLLLRAQLYRRAEKYEQAAQTIGQLLEKVKDDGQCYLEAGLIQQLMGNNTQAEQYYQKAIEVNPEDAEAYNTLAYFYAETGQKLDMALELVNKALKMKPNAGHMIDSLGWIYFQRGEYQDAAQQLEQAVKLMANNPDAIVLEHLGDAYAKLGRASDAQTTWRKALDLAPDSENLKKKLEQKL